MTTPVLRRTSADPFTWSRLPDSLLLASAAVLLVFSTVLSLSHWHRFDYALTHQLNRLVGHFTLLDHVSHDLTKDSFSSVPMVSLVWFAWFTRGAAHHRARIVAGVLATIIAMALCYKLQGLFPDHLRPLGDPDFAFTLPQAVIPGHFSYGLAFPSEHAALMFGLATSVWVVDRRCGGLGLALACGLGVARVYLGFIYPTDIIAGATLGILAAGIAQNRWTLRGSDRIVAWGARRQALFAALAFYVSFNIGKLFEDYRYVAAGVEHFVRSHLAR